MVTSGMHGVEGFCGSGGAGRHAGRCTVACRRAPMPAAWRCLMVRAVNPYGFSHFMRRASVRTMSTSTAKLHGFPQEPLPENAPYAEVAPMLLPEQWPPSEVAQAGADEDRGREGLVLVPGGSE
ncbi:DUF2817 domain-containing protein, partial [Cupriavidus basilensis]